jgi:PIN domain nuclease of toxin-antitoxin system
MAARKAILEADELYVSIITLWEIAMKFSRGGFLDLAVPENWEKSLIAELDSQDYRLLTVETHHCRLVQDLPMHHRDPFDRMLIAQAMAEKLAFISCDNKIDAYGLKKVW